MASSNIEPATDAVLRFLLQATMVCLNHLLDNCHYTGGVQGLILPTPPPPTRQYVVPLVRHKACSTFLAASSYQHLSSSGSHLGSPMLLLPCSIYPSLPDILSPQYRPALALTLTHPCTYALTVHYLPLLYHALAPSATTNSNSATSAPPHSSYNSLH